LKSNSIGKGILELRDVAYDKTTSTLVSVPIINKKASSKPVGYLYLRVSYEPRDLTLFDLDVIKTLRTLSELEKL